MGFGQAQEGEGHDGGAIGEAFGGLDPGEEAGGFDVEDDLLPGGNGFGVGEGGAFLGEVAEGGLHGGGELAIRGEGDHDRHAGFDAACTGAWGEPEAIAEAFELIAGKGDGGHGGFIGRGALEIERFEYRKPEGNSGGI